MIWPLLYTCISHGILSTHLKPHDVYSLCMDDETIFEDLKNKVNHCKKCPLYRTKIHYVFGSGSIKASIMFIGEAPGANEDRIGTPFVGRAGKILDELLNSINLKREEIYIANILKCRPPQNRNPSIEEIAACIDYLNNQIDIIKPNVLVPLGSFASKYILQKYDIPFHSISEVHGKIFQKNTIFGTLSIIPMFHPAVATYNPQKKNILLKDMKKLSEILSKNTIDSQICR